jgi:hypothetical protein
MVCCVEVETCLVGDVDGAGPVAVPRVLSHAGGFCEALLVVDCRRGVCNGVLGFSGELVGVVGFAVDGECPGELPPVVGRRKGDARGLLKESGEGLYGVGVVDCYVVSEGVGSPIA